MEILAINKIIFFYQIGVLGANLMDRLIFSIFPVKLPTDMSQDLKRWQYSDVKMSPMGSQITGFANVYSTVCSGPDRRKHQSSASLAFVRGIHRWPVTAQRASNAENISIWWRHHEKSFNVLVQSGKKLSPEPIFTNSKKPYSLGEGPVS